MAMTAAMAAATDQTVFLLDDMTRTPVFMGKADDPPSPVLAFDTSVSCRPVICFTRGRGLFVAGATVKQVTAARRARR
jgi:hypothetical protein